MTIGEKVRFVRMKLKLSQEDLATELGVAVSTVCRLERENREPQAMKVGVFYDFCESRNIDFNSAEHYGGKV